MKSKSIFLAALFLLVPFLLAACGGGADTQEAAMVNAQQEIYTKTQPPPFFNHSLQRQLMIDLYKAMNSSVATYTYVINQYTGKPYFFCPSIGFPIPANTELTNPSAVAWPFGPERSHGYVLPQAEPNGLYSSPSTSGTYVMCTNGDGTVSPQYFEQDVSTFTQPMNFSGGVFVPEDSQKAPSIRLQVQK